MPLSPLERHTQPTQDIHALNSVAEGQMLPAPESYAALVATRPKASVQEVKLEIREFELIQSKRQKNMVGVEKRFGTHFAGTGVPDWKKASADIQEIIKIYKEMGADINCLLHDRMKPLGLATNFSEEFPKLQAIAKEMTENFCLWQACIETTSGKEYERAFSTVSQSMRQDAPRELQMKVLQKGVFACNHLTKASMLLARLSADKPFPIPSFLYALSASGVQTVHAALCGLHATLSNLESEVINAAMLINYADAATSSAHLGTLDQNMKGQFYFTMPVENLPTASEVREANKSLMSQDEGLVKLTALIRTSKRQVSAYNKVIPGTLKTAAPTDVMQLQKSLSVVYGEKFDKHLLESGLDLFLLQVQKLDLTTSLMDISHGEFGGYAVLHITSPLATMIEEYASDCSHTLKWAECIASPTSRKTSACIATYGIDVRKNPPISYDGSPLDMYKMLSELHMRFTVAEKFIAMRESQFISMFAAEEPEVVKLCGTLSNKLKTIHAIACSVHQDIVSMLATMAPHVRGSKTMEQQYSSRIALKLGALRPVVRQYSEYRFLDMIDDHEESSDTDEGGSSGENNEPIENRAPATDGKNKVHALSKKLDGLSIDEPVDKLTESPKASQASNVPKKKVKPLTEARKQNLLTCAKRNIDAAKKFHSEANVINKTLSERLSEWYSSAPNSENNEAPLSAKDVRDNFNTPIALKNMVDLAANKTKIAAENFGRLANAMAKQPNAGDMKKLIDLYRQRAQDLHKEADDIRTDGMNHCLELIAAMPIQNEFEYLVESKQIDHIDRPTYAPVVKRDKDTKAPILDSKGNQQHDYVHEYKIHLKNGSSFVAHFRYEDKHADPAIATSYAEHFKTREQAKLGYSDQQKAADLTQIWEKIWRGPIDTCVVLPLLRSFLAEDERMPIPEVEDGYPIVR